MPADFNFSMAHDLAQLELAFQAFAQLTIDRMLAAKVATADDISLRLLAVAVQLRAAENFQAAAQLERLASFAEGRGSDLSLLDSPGIGGRQ